MEEIIIKKDENTKMDLNKKCFRFELATKIEIKIGYNYSIKKVIDLPKERIGIIYEIKDNECLFFIYSSKTFSKITEFQGCYFDVAKMEDNNLILCDEYNIYDFELIDNEYKLLQKIQCYEKIEENENYSHGNFTTKISFIYPLKNKDLIVCSYDIMKIYKKENRKYIYYKTIYGKYPIQEIIEINLNTIVLFMIKIIETDNIVKEFNYCLSLFSIQNDENKILVERRFFDYKIESRKIYLFKINNHLIAEYLRYLDIFDIEQNMKLINEQKIYKYEIPLYHFVAELKNSFILATKRDSISYRSFVYQYEDKSLKEYQEFPFNLDNTRIIKLKNNKLIIYSKNENKLINIFD